MSQHDLRQNLLDILKKLDTVMVVNAGRDRVLHGRPMAVADVEADGTLWFMAARDSEKTREVDADERALVTGQDGRTYLSVSGRMAVVDDHAKVLELWRESWKVWFPKGKDDPEIVLMRLRPEMGEYWSASGAAGVRYLFEAAKAYLSGERPSVEDPDQHAKVKM